MRSPARLATIIGVVAIAVPMISATAHAASGPRWRIVRVMRHCGNEGLLNVAATGQRDAWAIGLPYSSSPYCRMDVEHWNGIHWRRIPLPRGTAIGSSFTPPVTATSRTNAWVFPVRVGNNGLSYFEYNYALRWNGRVWQKSLFPVRLILTSAAALGPRNVWVFGWVIRQTGKVVPYAARYDGRAWHRATVPGAPLALSAVSSRDLWAVGPTVRTARKTIQNQVIIAMHWNGRRWVTFRVPAVAAHRGQRVLAGASVAAVGPGNLWWAYRGRTTGASPVTVLHWNGASWHPLAVPAAVHYLDAMTQDGAGGIWLLVEKLNARTGSGQAWYHFANGQWTSRAVPSPRGYNSYIFGMAWIPRSTSVWSVGEADRNRGYGAEGVIARYGS